VGQTIAAREEGIESASVVEALKRALRRRGPPVSAARQAAEASIALPGR
jgi:hypothetical protein